jgi:hypothetical protein
VEVARASRSLLLAAAAMFLFAALWQFLTYNGFPNDHYFHVARGRQMLLGEWPVRDFVDPGAPLQYAISAVARRLFGEAAASELLVVGLGVAVGAAATVVAAAWLGRWLIVALGVTLLEILASPRSYSYPKLTLYGLAGCLIVAITVRASRARLIMAGVLTAIAFLMRHDHGLFIGVACAAAIVLSASSLAEALRRFGVQAAVVAVLLLPWAMWVHYYQGLVPYFETGIAVSRREAEISLLRDWPRLQLSAGLTTDNVQAWLYYMFWTLPLVCMIAAVWRRVTARERWPGEWVAICAIALMAVFLDATFLRNPLSTRLADATVPAAMLGAWLVGLAWSMPSPRALALSARAGSIVLLAGTLVAIWRTGDVNGKLDEVGVYEDDLEHVQQHIASQIHALTVPEMDVRKLPSRVSAGLVPFLHYVDRCTTPADRLLVSGPYPDVFVLARRGFAGGQIAFREAFHDSDAEQLQTVERMRHQSVPFVVLPLDDQEEFERNFPRVRAHIAAAYDVLTEVQVDGLKGVRIMVERARPATGTDSATGWPCFVP